MSYHDYLGQPVDGLMAEWLKPLLGEPRRQPKEWHGPRFQGRELSPDAQCDAVARRDARMAELNKPAPVAVTVQDVFENLKDIVTWGAKARAKDWLWGQLRYSAMPVTEIQRRALEAGITRTALRRGRTALGVKPFQSGGAWFWELPGGGR